MNNMIVKKIFISASLFAVVGCSAVGTDYVRPQIHAPAVWQTELKTQNDEQLKNWWNSFNDETLNTLIGMTVKGNKDLKSAEYALRASRAKSIMTEKSALPTFEANGSATAINYGDKSKPDRNVDSYSAGFDASWEIDIFGGTKREIEAAYADADAQKEAYLDVLVSLTAETASNYITLRTVQNSIITAEEDIRINTDLYEISDRKFRTGLADASDVSQAEYTLEYSKTTLNDLKIQLNEAINRLSVLTGKNPGELTALLTEVKQIPDVPEQIAVSIPADVIRNRPDIRQAERQLAAQTARIGAAKSDLYPKFTLSGSIGYTAQNAGSLFSGENRTISFGPAFRWALFDLGSVRQNINVQTETQKKYLADYESAVLTAFEDVENALTSYDEQMKKNAQMKKALDAAEKAYDLELKKYNAGLSDYTAVKTAETAYISYKDKLAQGKGSADKYIISLYKALGGGWNTDGATK